MLWRTLAVALLALTAGCGTFASAGDPTPTVTPVPVTDVPTEPTTPTGVAPGLYGVGVRDVTRLTEAHRAAIDGETYVWNATLRVDSLPNASGNEHAVHEELDVENERRYRYYTNRRDLEERGDERMLNDVSEFADGDALYQRFVPFSDTEFTYTKGTAEPASVRYDQTMTGPIREFLAVPNATVAEARVDGQPYYRVEAERATTPGITVGRNFTVTALVSPRGFVRSLNASYEVDRPTRTSSVQYSFEYDRRADVSVERPDWVIEQWPTDAAANSRHGPVDATGDWVGPRPR